MVYLNIGKIIRKGKLRVIGGRKAVGWLAYAIRYTLIDSRAAEDLEVGINPGLALLNAPTYYRDNFASGEII